MRRDISLWSRFVGRPSRRLPAFLLCLASAHGAPEIDITARVDRAAVTVGDPVRYEITVSGPAGTRVELPAVRGNTGRLEVLDYAVRPDTVAADRMSVTHVLTLAAFATGRDTLPPQRVEIRMPSDGTDTAATVLYTQPTFITVTPTAPAGATDIADIHDGERLPRGFPWGLPVLLALVAGAVWLYRRWKRRRVLKPAPAVAPRLMPADEAALARLRGLEATVASLAQGDPDREAARTFAFTLSEILRQYLAARFGIDALEATTAELMERVAPLPLGSDRLAWLRTVSEELDAVKFAAGTVTPDDATRLIADARAFVHVTSAPVPATAAATVPHAAQGADAVPAPDTGRKP